MILECLRWKYYKKCDTGSLLKHQELFLSPSHWQESTLWRTRSQYAAVNACDISQSTYCKSHSRAEVTKLTVSSLVWNSRQFSFSKKHLFRCMETICMQKCLLGLSEPCLMEWQSPHFYRLMYNLAKQWEIPESCEHCQITKLYPWIL